MQAGRQCWELKAQTSHCVREFNTEQRFVMGASCALMCIEGKGGLGEPSAEQRFEDGVIRGFVLCEDKDKQLVIMTAV